VEKSAAAPPPLATYSGAGVQMAKVETARKWPLTRDMSGAAETSALHGEARQGGRRSTTHPLPYRVGNNRNTKEGGDRAGRPPQ
jgi:hypothetical protein